MSRAAPSSSWKGRCQRVVESFLFQTDTLSSPANDSAPLSSCTVELSPPTYVACWKLQMQYNTELPLPPHFSQVLAVPLAHLHLILVLKPDLFLHNKLAAPVGYVLPHPYQWPQRSLCGYWKTIKEKSERSLFQLTAWKHSKKASSADEPRNLVTYL